MKHEIAPSIRGCLCSLCGEPAAHKVGEESCGPPVSPLPTAEQAADYYLTGQTPPNFHNLTNWLCCRHFAAVMGPLAAIRCGVPYDPPDCP